MSKFIVVVFPNEKKAYEGVHALTDLHADGSIAVYGHAVLHRTAEGPLLIKEQAFEGPVGLSVGAVVGGLVGLLGGPAGAAIGLASGSMIGGLRDLFNLGISEDFLESVERDLTPGKYAVIAEISEEWVMPLDSRMEDLGAKVVREWREDVIDETIEGRIAAGKAALAKLRAERAAAKAEKMQAKLATEIEQATAKLKRSADKAKVRLERSKQEADAKMKALQHQAARADAHVKRQIDERMAEMRTDFDHRTAKLKAAWELTQQALRP